MTHVLKTLSMSSLEVTLSHFLAAFAHKCSYSEAAIHYR